MVVPVMTSYPAGEHWTASHHCHTTADLLEALHHQVVLHRAAEAATTRTAVAAQSASTNPVRAVRVEEHADPTAEGQGGCEALRRESVV